MKISAVGARSIPARHGGLEVAVEELARELGGRGHQVQVLIDRKAVDHGLTMEQAIEGVSVLGVPCVRSKHLHAITQSLFSLLSVYAQPPDIVHFHGVGPGMASRLVRGLPSVITVQGLDWQRGKWSGAAATTFKAGVRATIGRADAVVAVSRAVRDSVQEIFGIDAQYIPNGVRIPETNPDPSILDQWGLAPTEYILFASRIVPEKGLEYLLEAHAKTPGLPPLIVAGSGEKSYAAGYEQELRSAAGSDVHFVGFQSGESLRALFAHAQAFVLPSVMEGLPLALLEAMSYGVPVVHSAIPECSEITRGDAGLAFRPRDSASLAERLRYIDANRAEAQAVGRSGRRRVAEEYSWSSIAERYEEVYSALLEQRVQHS